MENLNEAIKVFFSCSRRLFDNWLVFSNNSLKAVNRLQNHSAQYQIIRRTKLPEIKGLDSDDVKNKLLFNIMMNMEMEMEDLENLRKSIEDEIYKLERLHDKVELVFEGLSWEELPEGIVPYDIIIERVHLLFRYFQGLYANFNCGLKACDYSNETDVQRLKEAVTSHLIPYENIKESIEYGNVFIANLPS